MPAELQALKQEAERRLAEWATTGCGLVSSSLYDACCLVFDRPRRPSQSRRADRFHSLWYNHELWHRYLNVDTALYFDDASRRLAPDAESMIVLANPVLPHSEGEIVLESADPAAHPAIRMNYFGDPHDLKVMVAVLRRALEIVAHWPAHRKIGPLMVPPFLAEKHGIRRAGRRATLFSRISRCIFRSPLPPDLHLPDRQRRRSATPGTGVGSCAWRMQA